MTLCLSKQLNHVKLTLLHLSNKVDDDVDDSMSSSSSSSLLLLLSLSLSSLSGLSFIHFSKRRHGFRHGPCRFIVIMSTGVLLKIQTMFRVISSEKREINYSRENARFFLY